MFYYFFECWTVSYFSIILYNLKKVENRNARETPRKHETEESFSERINRAQKTLTRKPRSSRLYFWIPMAK